MALVEIMEPIMPIRSGHDKVFPNQHRDQICAAARALTVICAVAVWWNIKAHHLIHRASPEYHYDSPHANFAAEHETDYDSYDGYDYGTTWPEDVWLLLRWRSALEAPDNITIRNASKEVLGKFTSDTELDVEVIAEHRVAVFKLMSSPDQNITKEAILSAWDYALNATEIADKQWSAIVRHADTSFPATLDMDLCHELPYYDHTETQATEGDSVGEGADVGEPLNSMELPPWQLPEGLQEAEARDAYQAVCRHFHFGHYHHFYDFDDNEYGEWDRDPGDEVDEMYGQGGVNDGDGDLYEGSADTFDDSEV